VGHLVTTEISLSESDTRTRELNNGSL